MGTSRYWRHLICDLPFVICNDRSDKREFKGWDFAGLEENVDEIQKVRYDVKKRIDVLTAQMDETDIKK